jgi:hypothetical protein
VFDIDVHVFLETDARLFRSKSIFLEEVSFLEFLVQHERFWKSAFRLSSSSTRSHRSVHP